MKKALWILYDIVLDEDLTTLLDGHQVTGYTRWPRLSGKGPKSGARLDSHVWPGANAAILTVQDEAMVDLLMKDLQALRDDVGGLTGVWAFTTPVLDLLK
ncbi:MAG: hypothetical protein LBN38_07115 [Verrucomicrobiota bacterium]|jgi:hypothetical protein|nr:hypothetical protein [Verrucomicrobiota bacterium]